MKVVLTVTVGPFCLWVMFFDAKAEAVPKEWASGVFGALMAYWFK